MRFLYQGQFVDQSGNVVSDGTITIYLAGTTTLASVYTTLTGPTAVNSVTSDSNGYFKFYHDNFDYDYDQDFDIVLSKSGFLSKTYYNIQGEGILGSYTISAPKTVTTHVKVPKGVLYTKAGAGTLTFSGTFEAGLYQVFSSFASGNVTFSSGSVKEVYPQWWGATAGLTSDSSSAITAALAAFGQVKINSTFRVDSMIELETEKTLLLSATGGLTRTTDTANTEPVVWMKGNYATLRGINKMSQIYSQNRAPNGIVRLGHKNMTESHANVQYCTLRDFVIVGGTDQGQVAGNPDVGLYMANPQLGGLVNYFHSIFGIKIQQVNHGIELIGYANGNIINDIQLYKVGNDSGVGRAGIYIRGAQENQIGTIWHHSSSNSYTIVVENYDNTGVGGSNHEVQFNTIGPVMSEQGGANAKCLVISSISVYNQFNIQDNTASGNTIPAYFYNDNVLLNKDAIYISDINTQMISFPATQVPSAGANTLDDYEESTWTMGMAFGGGVVGITYSQNNGYYTKIGNMVFATGYLLLTSKGTSVGVATLTGLPFTSVNDNAAFSAVSLRFANITFANQYQGYIDKNSKTIVFEEITEAGAVSNLADTDFSNNSAIMVSAIYRAQ